MLPQQQRRMQRYTDAQMLVLLENYVGKWMRAREAAFERWLADILGHAREHDARDFAIVEVPPRHLMTQTAKLASVWWGIDRSVEPSWSAVQRVTAPISVEAIQEGMRRMLEYRPPPPIIKPWLPRHRADELIASGISPKLIMELFQLF